MKSICMCCGELYNPEDDADGSCAEFCSNNCYNDYEDALDDAAEEELYYDNHYEDDDTLWDEDFDDSWLDEDDDDEDD